MKWEVLVSLSAITQIEFFFLAVRGKPTLKYILMWSHFYMGIDKGWSTPTDFKWLAFIRWQVSHSATYLAISTFILDHQKFCFKSWYILVFPGWIENLNILSSSKIVFLIYGSTGTTRRLPNQITSFWSFWKHVYLGSPSASLGMMIYMSSSMRWAVTILS
jgi:hypothetical protein